MRIEQHPILGTYDKGPLVEFTMDGKAMTGYEGEPIAAALRAAGILQHRRTRKTGEARGVFCAIGRCTDCVMVVDAVPNIRTCIMPLRAGIKIHTQYALAPKEDAE